MLIGFSRAVEIVDIDHEPQRALPIPFGTSFLGTALYQCGMGERTCYREYCPECDAQVTIVDDECPDCDRPLEIK